MKNHFGFNRQWLVAIFVTVSVLALLFVSCDFSMSCEGKTTSNDEKQEEQLNVEESQEPQTESQEIDWQNLPELDPTIEGHMEVLEYHIFLLINQARNDRGLSSLVWNHTLSVGARLHSLDMQELGYVTHATGDFSELVYYNKVISANSVLLVWLNNTTGYKEVLLAPELRIGGVGVAIDRGFWVTFRCR